MNGKKSFPILMLVIFSIFLCSCDSWFKFDDNEGISPDTDMEIADCFNQVNAFRTGNEAWYWNSDNSTKTDLSGKLKKLVLDEELCKAAQIRANEIISNFSHTRPDGSSCFTVLKECSISCSSCGENIASGRKTGIATFNQWKEDDYKYDGQGHRRNMLGGFTKIGIAYAVDSNGSNRYYWAMILTK